VSSPAAARVAYRDLVLYRRIWRENFVGAFVQPFLYLLGVGVGIGSLVDQNAGAEPILDGVSYFSFYASALLATTAMFNASQEALWPTMDGFMNNNAYRAMVATPISPGDVASGLAIHFAGRTAVGATGVALVLSLFADTRSLGLLLAVPVAVLCGLAFAMPIAAWTASRTSERSFPAILRFAILPMFLFGGAFFPIDQLPAALQVIAWLTPLFHAIELCRGAILGGLNAGAALLHLGVLNIFAVGGWGLCQWTFRRRLWP